MGRIDAERWYAQRQVLEGTNRWLLYAAWNLRLIAFGDASLKDPFGQQAVRPDRIG